MLQRNKIEAQSETSSLSSYSYPDSEQSSRKEDVGLLDKKHQLRRRFADQIPVYLGPNTNSNDHRYSLLCTVFVISMAFLYYSHLSHHIVDESRLSTTHASSSSSHTLPEGFHLVQVQVVHRHGDRTPLTPLRNERFWHSMLPTEKELEELQTLVKLKLVKGYHSRKHRNKPVHTAAGDGPTFGRLTSRGLHQMMKVGRIIRAEMVNAGISVQSKGIVASSTDFPRTRLSAEAFLYGFLDDGSDFFQSSSLSSQSRRKKKKKPALVVLDVKHTDQLIPDPQPRRWKEQESLEKSIMAGEEFRRREEEIKPLAEKMTKILLDANLIDERAFKINFGVGDDKPSTNDDKSILGWTQLSEVTKCLRTNGMLPFSITPTEQDQIMDYVAWRWYEILRHPLMADMAVKSLVKKMILNALKFADLLSTPGGKKMFDNNHRHVLKLGYLHLFSGHDATLIALMCAFRLERPGTWPDYASYLKMELFRDDSRSSFNFFVRFSLNGNTLRSAWGSADGKHSTEFIALEDLRTGLNELELRLPAE